MTDESNPFSQDPEQNSLDPKSSPTLTSKEEVLETPAESLEDSPQDVFGDDAGLEQDGDIFWDIQRVAWGIIKTVGTLGVLGILIWLIWKPGITSPQEVTTEEKIIIEEPTVPVITTEEPTPEEEPSFWSKVFKSEDKIEPTQAPPEVVSKPTLPVEPQIQTQESETSNPDPQNIAYQLETDRSFHSGGPLPQAVTWLKEAKNIGEISLEIIRGTGPPVRAQKVEAILKQADRLFTESDQLVVVLQTERQELMARGQEANNQIDRVEAQISAALQQFQAQDLEKLVLEKVRWQTVAANNLSQAKIRDTLLRNVQSFDQLLRQKSIPLLIPATEFRSK